MPKEKDIKLINPLPVAFYDTRDAEKYGITSAIIKQFLEQRTNSVCFVDDEPYFYSPDTLALVLGLTQDEVVKAVDNLVKHGVVVVTSGEHGEHYLDIQGTVPLEEAYL